MRKIYLINELYKYDGDNANEHLIEAYSSKKKAKKRMKKLNKENTGSEHFIRVMGLNVTSRQYLKKAFKS